MVPLLVTILVVLVVGMIAGAIAWLTSSRRFRARLSHLERTLRDNQGTTGKLAVYIRRMREDVARLTSEEDGDKDRSGREDLVARIESLRGELDELRQAVEAMREAAAAAPALEAASPGGDRTPEENVERHLRGQGFDEVRFLGDRGDVEDATALRLSVSARKDGILHKGFAMFEGGIVTQLRLNPITRMFP